MDATIDGVRIFYEPVGRADGYPIIVLHGGPGLDHTEFRPWLDPLGESYQLIYVDERGQGRSDRVDPATLSLSRFARDVTELAAALGMRDYAVLGHSYGAFITLAHAVEESTASHYVISSGTASFSKTGQEIQQNLASFEPVELREQVTQSWALEPQARTPEDCARIMRMQWPFHFASVQSEAYRRFLAEPDRTVYAPEVLAYFATNEYPIEYEGQLGTITKPTLIVTGDSDRTCTPRAGHDMHAGIPGSELVVLPDAGHMTFIEQPERYFAAVRDFFARHGVRA
jgi:proline iminopeptidase